MFIQNFDKFLNDFNGLRSGKKIVFTNGCFDILHVGHIRYLQEARAQGDYLIVALNSDASVRRLKGEERPLQHQDERAEILAALGSVDATFIFDEDTPESSIRKVRPEVLVKGGDWPIEQIVGHEFVQSYGGDVRSLKFVPGRSTSLLVEQIKK